MSFFNALAQDILDDLFGKGAFSPPTIYIGLSSTTPTEAGANITEPSAGAYARITTSAGDWNSATLADPSLIDNALALTFPQASADWLAGADLTHMVAFDAVSGGNAIFFGALTTAKPVLNGDTAEFAAGALDVTLA